jgi:hypothetical protein
LEEVSVNEIMTQEQAEAWLMDPPGGKFLTAEHLLLPHTVVPGGEPVDTVWSYGSTGLFWGGGSYLLGHLLGKNAEAWGRNGLILGLGVRLLGGALALGAAAGSTNRSCGPGQWDRLVLMPSINRSTFLTPVQRDVRHGK